MKILFVCRHNRFRSKVAEAYFKKTNKNKRIKLVSAGIFKGRPVDKRIISIGKKLGINISKITNGLKEKSMKTIDLIVIVADDVPASLFRDKVKKIIVWKIKDTALGGINEKKIEITMKQIMEKVNELNKTLEKKR
jgi:protein-tyrosine-phosphatase